MKAHKKETLKMLLAVAVVGVIKGFEYWHRNRASCQKDQRQLNKKLNRINLLYHAIGIFYNE